MLMDARVTRGIWRRSVLMLGLLSGAMPVVHAAEPAPTCAVTNAERHLSVRVTGMRSDKGNLTVTVYPDDADRFLSRGGKLLRLRVSIVLPMTEACFVLPAAGNYAVAVYHDANDDHDFNRNFVGLPAEGYGFSNNPVTKLGLPTFKEVRFDTQPGNNPIYIKLTY